MHGERILVYVLVGIVIVGLMAFRMQRMSRARPLKLERLWIVPALFGAMLVVTLYEQPPQGIGWLYVAAALALGGAAGWVRGSTQAIAVDPETHALNVKASPWAIAFLVGLIALRFGLRYELMGNAGALHLSVATITDAFLAFAVGLLAVQRVEMAIRARKLLAAAKGLLVQP